jgi:hypothetical protein
MVTVLFFCLALEHDATHPRLSSSAMEYTMVRACVSRVVRLRTDAGTHEPETGTRLANFAVCCRTGDGIGKP